MDNMEGVRTILFLLVLCRSVSSLELTGPSVYAARLGSEARVPCWFTVDKPSVDLNHLTIFWQFLEKEILSYSKTVRTTSPRYSLSTETLRTGVANLAISNIQIPDGGMYKCSVTYGSELKEKEVRLDIGAPPQVTVTDKMAVVNVESVLRCSVTGFYPVDIDIKWFKDGEKLNNISTEDPRRNPDRTYSVNSTVIITPTEEDRARIFSCRVYHDFLQVPLQKDFRLEYGDRSLAGIIAACSVSVVILIIIIISGVLWWKRKSRWRKDIGPPIVRDIAGPRRLIDGEEAVLYCTIDNAPEDLSVTWLMRRAGREQEIQTSQMREHSEEEEESLLDTSCVIRSQREGHQYSSSLSFIPHMETHKDVTFICRAVSGKHKDEKMYHCETIYGKPQMSAPIEITLADSSRVQFSLNLQKFYPKDIKIFWSLENKYDKYPLSTVPKISPRSDDVTYEVSSVVSVPDDQFKDPEMKIIVEWKHGSTERPETRSLSVRDFPWRPQVGSISVPELEDGKEATLTCDIFGYFPNLLSVTWFTKKDGNVTALPKESSNTDRNVTVLPRESSNIGGNVTAVPKETSNTDGNVTALSRESSNIDRTYKMPDKWKRQTDNTYSCVASVTFTPIISSDEGSEILCRVEHPSEERPIERSTGPLHIGERKQSSVLSKLSNIGSVSIRIPSCYISLWPSNKEKRESVEEATESTGTEEATESKGADCQEGNKNPDC